MSVFSFTVIDEMITVDDRAEGADYERDANGTTVLVMQKMGRSLYDLTAGKKRVCVDIH